MFGLAVRLKFGPAVTVDFSVVVCVMLPDTPEMVMVEVPTTVPDAVKVSVLVDDAGLGLNPAVTPFGKPEALKVEPAVNPLMGLTVTVLVP